MVLRTRLLPGLLAALSAFLLFGEAPALARVDPQVWPPVCDPGLQVCGVMDPATGKARVWPRDIARFQADVETCIHFAGEEPYDDARRRQIDAAVKKHCGGSERAAPKLRKKYAGNPLVLERINTIQALRDSAL